jgi:hypothetical protein
MGKRRRQRNSMPQKNNKYVEDLVENEENE